MKFINISVIIYFAWCINNIFCSNVSKNNNYLKFRNTFLRLSLLKHDTDYEILFKEKVKSDIENIFNTILLKLNEINIEYNTIPDDDRFIIETILGLVF